MAREEETGCSTWTWDQEKLFENALAGVPEDSKDRWEQIMAAVPGRTIEDIKQHYGLLVEDVESIESGRVPLLNYLNEDVDEGGNSKKMHGDSHHPGKGSKSEQDRRKGIAWTEEEHRQFLLGLDKYGKGDWRSISRNFVVTRTPTQVASHAQKYFIRLNSMNKDRRRSSIHDITSVGNSEASEPQGPITGQSSVTAVIPGKSSKHSPQTTAAGLPAVAVYGTTTGQLGGGPLVSAVGTPITLPVSAKPHIAYRVQVPVSGAMVPGAPVNLPPMTYSIAPNTSAPR